MSNNYPNPIPTILYDCSPPSPTPPIDLEATTPTNLPIDHLQNVLASQVTPLLDAASHPEPPAFELPSNASAPKRKRIDEAFEEEWSRVTKESMDRVTKEAQNRKLEFRARLKAEQSGKPGNAAEISSRREARVSRQYQTYLREGLAAEVKRLIGENLILRGRLLRKRVKVEETGVPAV